MAVAILATVQVAPARAAVSSVPAALSVQVVPPVLPADGGTYPAIYVSLVDSSGSPTLAVSDVTVYLTSSTPAVGVVLNSSLVISIGKGYAMASFTTTPTVGSTKITASATGLASGTTTVTTAVLHGYPTSISLDAVPSEVNSTSTSSRSGTLIVEFQDQAGQPAKAANDTQVSVYSSSPKIVALNATSFTMKAGQLSKVLSFSTGFVPGSALVTASAPQLGSGTAQVTVLGRPPLALQLYVQPSQLVTSGTGRLVIALTDLSGNPTRAPTNTIVQIRSSSTSAVSAPTTATISAGSIYTAVTLSAGAKPGNATITVSSSGLKSGFATIFTSAAVGPAVALKLYVGPSPVLADHGNYSTVVVSLLNSTGSPTISTSPKDVTLTSSQNSSVGAFGPSAFSSMTIPQGDDYVIWSVPFTSTFVAGATSLTVSAQDLLPATGTLSTFGPVPSKLAVSSLFGAVPADGGSHPALEVSLEDSTGAPAVASTPVTVFLTSSQSGIARLNSPVVIGPGESATVADVTSTSVSGMANITAYTNSLSSGYTSASALIQTVSPSPSAIGAYLAPSVIAPSPTQKGAVLVLQLQDSVGNPAKARSPTTLTITSSDSSVFNQTLQVQIPQGASFIVVPVVPLESGSTTFTVTSPGLTAATAKFQVLGSLFVAQLTSSSLSIFTNGTATVTLAVAIEGGGVKGASVTWSATGGTVSPVTSITNDLGQASTTLKPSAAGVATVTAVVSSPSTGTQTLSSEIIVNPAPPAQRKGLLESLLSFPYVLIIVALVAAVVILIVLLIRRRRRAGEAESALMGDEQGFGFYRPDRYLSLGEH